MKKPTLFQLSPKTILLQWDAVISEEIHEAIAYTNTALHCHAASILQETTPAYNELAVFTKEALSVSAFRKILEQALAQQMDAQTVISRRQFTIPVCYEPEYGIDLDEVLKFHNISKETLIQRHTQPIYGVSFIGFLPGFPYLTGLPETLYTPRKEQPRPHIVKGSVGIGGKQTGVYPSNSPGGWNIIGRTPIPLFSVQQRPFCLLKAGDTIQFKSVSAAEFDLISLELASGLYSLQSQPQ